MAFILPLFAMLTKEPGMLQPDAFCEHTMQQNVTAAGAPPWTAAGAYSSLAGFNGPLRGEEGKGGGRAVKWEKEREGKLTLMRSRNRAPDWLRPALIIKLHSGTLYIRHSLI